MESVATQTALKHRKEVDVGVGQHACPQVGELGLGTIVVSEDVNQLALHWRSDQSDREAGVPDKVVELAAVGHQPPCEPFSICLAALGEFASVCFSKEMIASLTLRDLSRPDSARKARSCVGAQPPSEKCLPNQAGMTGWQVASNSYS